MQLGGDSLRADGLHDGTRSTVHGHHATLSDRLGSTFRHASSRAGASSARRSVEVCPGDRRRGGLPAALRRPRNAGPTARARLRQASAGSASDSRAHFNRTHDLAVVHLCLLSDHVRDRRAVKGLSNVCAMCRVAPASVQPPTAPSRCQPELSAKECPASWPNKS